MNINIPAKETSKNLNDIISKNLKSLEEMKDFKELKEKLDKGNNFIDYFLVIGQEPTIYREKWLYTSDLSELNEKYKEQFKPKIISSFPSFEKSTIAFDDTILIHIFPNGYKLLKSKQKPKSKVFSFILDNNYYNLNYPQKYLTCLICYESIAQYKILQTLESSGNITEDEKEEIKTQPFAELYIPKCILIMSLYPFFGEFEKIITEIYSYSQNLVFKQINLKETIKDSRRVSLSFRLMSTFAEEIKEQLPEIPLEKIIENLLIELPVPPRGVSDITYFLNEEERTIKQNKMNELPLIDINLQKIFVEFSIKDIINIYNCIFLESRILFFSKNIEYLNNFIYGLLALLYPFQYQYQIVTILPKINFEIIESPTPFIAGINQSFYEQFFDFHKFILEDSILIVDIDSKKVQMKNEKTKLPEFPSKYKKNLEKKLQEITNKYLKKFKIDAKSGNNRQKKIKASFPHNDNSRLGSISGGTPSTMNDTPINISKSMALITPIDMLNHTNSIEDEGEIEEDFNELDQRNELLNNLNINYNFNQEVADLFFNFNANLLSDYNKYLNTEFYSTNTMPSLEMLFKVPEYLKTIPPADKPFYTKFVEETQIFGDFIYLRMIPKNSKEKIRILKFDEKITENSNTSRSNKTEGVFTDTKEYDFVTKSAIQRPRKLSDKEKNFYQDEKNRKKLLSFGVEVKIEKIKSEKEPFKVYFSYPIFPKLTNLLFLNETIKDYFPPSNFNEELDIINDDIISKSHLADVSIRLVRVSDMKKYIYLCWIQLWALTFWYCEENEKRYWFKQLIGVIKRSSCYEIEIFNLLFDVLSKYGKEYMILKLYSLLVNKKLNPSFKVHNMVMKIMDAKLAEEKQKEGKTPEGISMEGNFSENLRKVLEKEDKIPVSKTNFSKRTFRSKYFSNILTENIQFFAFDACYMCQKDINLETYSNDFKSMKRDLNWVVCPGCGESILPKLTVKFGEEINKTGDMKKNTCIVENIVLFSPYILKNNYNTFFKKNEMKLDVEKFMLNYSTIFWDSLWYFKLNNLEYDFMQPYYYRFKPIKISPELNISLDDFSTKNAKNEKQLISNNNINNNIFDYSKLQICNFNFII